MAKAKKKSAGDDEAAIRELMDTWMTATAAGDLDTLLTLMADDVVFLTPGQPHFGKKEFTERLKNIGQTRIEGKSNIREIRVTGEWAFAWTHLEIIITPVDGATQVRKRGDTLTIFQRLPNDRWILARDANLLG